MAVVGDAAAAAATLVALPSQARLGAVPLGQGTGAGGGHHDAPAVRGSELAARP